MVSLATAAPAQKAPKKTLGSGAGASRSLSIEAGKSVKGLRFSAALIAGANALNAGRAAADSAPILERLGRIYLALGRPDSARGNLDNALALYTTARDSSRVLGRVAETYLVDSPATAIRGLRATLGRNPDDSTRAAIYMALGIAYRDSASRLQRRESTIDSAIHNLDSAGTIWRRLGERNQEFAARNERAASELVLGLGPNARSADSALEAVRAEQDQGVARHCFDSASLLPPDDREFCLIVARTLQLRGRAALLNGDGLDSAGPRFESALISLRRIVNSVNSLGADRYGVTYVQRTMREVYEWWAEALNQNPQLVAAVEAADRGRGPAGLAFLSAPTGQDAAAWQNVIYRMNSEGPLSANGGDVALDSVMAQDAGVLYYLQTSESIVRWFIRKQNSADKEARHVARRAVWRIKPDSLGRIVRALQHALANDQESLTCPPNAPARQRSERSSCLLKFLSDSLLPSELRLPRRSGILIVPAGAVSLVPFAALPAPGDTTPFGAKYLLHYTPSLRTQMELIGRGDRMDEDGQGPDSVQNLVVGNPDMPLEPGTRDKLRPLNYARAEADSIFKLPDWQLLTDTGATEARVREQLPKMRYIHFATHGKAYGHWSDVWYSYIALAPGRGDDGLLTVAEVAQLQLNAELVVLSACETGLGDVTPEGIIGFQRAFLVRGARRVLVSLWKVDDEATGALMLAFHKHYARAKSAPAALWSAQNEVRKHPEWNHPFFWAGFQLVGPN